MRNVLVWLLVALSWGAVAHASPITFGFTGTVTQDPLLDPGDPFGGTIAAGTALSGTYTFESTTPDSDPAPNSGSYTSSPGSLSLTIGGNAFVAADLLNIGVGNDFSGSDFYTVFAQNTSGADPFDVSLILQDTDGTVLGGALLLTDAPLLAAFEIATFFFAGEISGNQVQIDGVLTSLTCLTGCVPGGGGGTPVPEPATLALLGAGLASVALWRRRARVSRLLDDNNVASEATMIMRIGLSLGVLTFAVVVAAAPAAHAVDGQILINQARALAGGVTPGDAAGFPVTITQPGSYRLSGNLVVPNSNTTAIEIKASNVTLDLNGFAILGPTDCSAALNPCAGEGTADGITTGFTTPQFSITIRNGTIQGMGANGISLLGDSNLVEYIHVRSNGEDGIRMFTSLDSGSSIVQHCTAQRNGSVGIFLVRGAVRHNVSDANGFRGIVLSRGSASYNVATRNSVGLDLGNGASYFGNVLLESGFANVTSGINLGQNLCDDAVCPGAQF